MNEFSIAEITYVILSILSIMACTIAFLLFQNVIHQVETRVNGPKVQNEFAFYGKVLFISIPFIQILAVMALVVATKISIGKPVYIYYAWNRIPCVVALSILYIIEVTAMFGLLLFWVKMVKVSLVLDSSSTGWFIETSLKFSKIIETKGRLYCTLCIFIVSASTIGAGFSVLPDYIRCFPVAISVSVPLAILSTILLSPVGCM